MSQAIRPASRRVALRIGLGASIIALAAAPARACDLDGLSHGYGPMAALFAGAHHYQSLNGLEDEEPPPQPATVDAPAEAAARSPGSRTAASVGADASTVAARPPTPRRSFVAWAKATPKSPADVRVEAPAAWTGRAASAPPPRAAPRSPDGEPGERAPSPPSGGPVP